MSMRTGNTKGLGVETEIVYHTEGIKEKQDVLILEDFTIPKEYNRGRSSEIVLEKGVLLSFYNISFAKYTSSIDKALYVNLRLLKAHNQGYDNPLVAKQFQIYLSGLSGLKFKQVTRDSHLLKVNRQAKIKALLG